MLRAVVAQWKQRLTQAPGREPVFKDSRDTDDVVDHRCHQAALIKALPTALRGQARSQCRSQLRKNIRNQTWLQGAAQILQHTLPPGCLEGTSAGNFSQALGGYWEWTAPPSPEETPCTTVDFYKQQHARVRAGKAKEGKSASDPADRPVYIPAPTKILFDNWKNVYMADESLKAPYAALCTAPRSTNFPTTFPKLPTQLLFQATSNLACNLASTFPNHSQPSKFQALSPSGGCLRFLSGAPNQMAENYFFFNSCDLSRPRLDLHLAIYNQHPKKFPSIVKV